MESTQGLSSLRALRRAVHASYVGLVHMGPRIHVDKGDCVLVCLCARARVSFIYSFIIYYRVMEKLGP
jgi:hypothetical protein